MDSIYIFDGFVFTTNFSIFSTIKSLLTKLKPEMATFQNLITLVKIDGKFFDAIFVLSQAFALSGKVFVEIRWLEKTLTAAALFWWLPFLATVLLSLDLYQSSYHTHNQRTNVAMQLHPQYVFSHFSGFQQKLFRTKLMLWEVQKWHWKIFCQF